MQQTAQDGRIMQTFIQAYVRNMKLLNFHGKCRVRVHDLHTYNMALDRNNAQRKYFHSIRRAIFYFIESVIPSISNKQNLQCSIFAFIPICILLSLGLVHIGLSLVKSVSKFSKLAVIRLKQISLYSLTL